MASQEPRTDTMQHSVQRKDSKLRRAVEFFKHLGFKKSYSRHKGAGSSSGYDTESHDTWLDKRRRPEMEDTSQYISMRAELGGRSSSGAHDHGSYPETRNEPVYEIEGTRVHTSQDRSHASQCAQVGDTAFQPAELNVEPLVMGPQSRGEAASSAISFTGIGFQPEAVRHGIELREMPMSPVSPIGVDVALCQSVFPLAPESLANLGDRVTPSTQLQSEELRETVRILNEEWLWRALSVPEVTPRTRSLSPQFLLEKGAETLQLIFRRKVLPETFDAVFALAHIACAAAYIMHRDNSSYCWNEFFQHILKLQNLILNGSDAQQFVQLVKVLWPQGLAATRFCGNNHLDETTATLVPLRTPIVGLEGLPSAGSIDLQAPHCPTKLLQECSNFLDGKLSPQYSLNSV